jgi:hypothetical protein
MRLKIDDPNAEKKPLTEEERQRAEESTGLLIVDLDPDWKESVQRIARLALVAWQRKNLTVRQKPQ